jgi:hypothetical protein
LTKLRAIEKKVLAATLAVSRQRNSGCRPSPFKGQSLILSHLSIIGHYASFRAPTKAAIIDSGLSHSSLFMRKLFQDDWLLPFMASVPALWATQMTLALVKRFMPDASKLWLCGFRMSLRESGIPKTALALIAKAWSN